MLFILACSQWLLSCNPPLPELLSYHLLDIMCAVTDVCRAVLCAQVSCYCCIMCSKAGEVPTQISTIN